MSYDTLCEAAEDANTKVLLYREEEAGTWGLHLVIRPAGLDPSWRATAVTFPSLEELDATAEHVLPWLRFHRPEKGGGR